MTGKEKCKKLKEIRKAIAQENDIAYVTENCTHKGDCLGTCPQCEAEVRYLEEELRKRQAAGKRVAVAGIAAALVITSSGCSFIRDQVKKLEEDMTSGIVAPPLSGWVASAEHMTGKEEDGV